MAPKHIAVKGMHNKRHATEHGGEAPQHTGLGMVAVHHIGLELFDVLYDFE